MNKILFRSSYGLDPIECFPNTLRALEEEGLIIPDHERIRFAPKGFKYRNLISQLFFSDEVVKLESEYDYKD